MAHEVIHATAVAIDARGLILVGASGCGKSDLALRLIDAGAILVADDRLICAAVDGQLLLSAPPAIAGLIEVRGVGLLSFPHETAVAALVLACDAVPERLPHPAHRIIAGIRLPLLACDARAPSAAAKARVALALAVSGRLWQNDVDPG